LEMFELLQWRTLKPEITFALIDEEMGKRLG